MRGMRIVVIGGTGHIGSYLCPQLVEAGYSVVCVSRGLRSPYQESKFWREIEFHELERNAEESKGRFGEAIASLDADAVVDLTCYLPDSAHQLVDALRGRVKHFVHCGTIWVHGPSTQVPTTENERKEPFGDYGIRKQSIETYLLQQALTGEFPATILHPGHLVGTGWNPVNPAGNFNPQVFTDIASGREILLPNLGMETVHHVHCADVAAAFVNAIKRREVSLGQSFHVVSPAALTLRGYAARMAEWFGRSPRMKFLPWEEWRQTVSEKDARATWDHIAHSPNCSIEKARRILGYEPRYSSLAAVKESVEWLVAEGAVSTS
jgi:nucleoside-diphosphate-sugar epimerase